MTLDTTLLDATRRIVALLQEHPEGLSPTQVRQILGIDKNLNSTMKAMARDGVCGVWGMGCMGRDEGRGRHLQ